MVGYSEEEVGITTPGLFSNSRKDLVMGAGAIAAIVIGTLLVGAAADRGNTNPGFKAEFHKEASDPSKAES